MVVSLSVLCTGSAAAHYEINDTSPQIQIGLSEHVLTSVPNSLLCRVAGT